MALDPHSSAPRATRRPVGQPAPAERTREARQRPDGRGQGGARQSQVIAPSARATAATSGSRSRRSSPPRTRPAAAPRPGFARSPRPWRCRDCDGDAPTGSMSLDRLIAVVAVRLETLPATGLDQHAAQEGRVDQAGDPEAPERGAPAGHRTECAAQRPAARRADIDAGLVDAHRSRPRFRPVVIGDHRHRGREVERLAQPLRRAVDHELGEAARQAGRRADRGSRMPAPTRSGSCGRGDRPHCR